MSWKDKLIWKDKTYKKASFRDATFYVESSDISVGRRNIIHQYPFKEVPYVEDMGSDASKFTIIGFVIQNNTNDFDYLTEKNLLISSLKKSGSGLLVHPFYGRINVCLSGQARIEESISTNGGMARITMTFVETGSNQYPQKTVDPVESVRTVGETANSKVEDTFKSHYDYTSDSHETIITTSQSACNMVNRVLINTWSPDRNIIDIKATLENANSYLVKVDDYVSTATDYIYFMTRIIDDPLRTLGLTAPYNLGNSIVQAFCSLVHFGDTLNSDNISRYGGQLVPVTITTSTTAKRALNQEMIVSLYKSKALINATKMASTIIYDSYDRSIYITKIVIEAIDYYLDDLGSKIKDEVYTDYGLTYTIDDLYDVMQLLKKSFIESMKLVGADLSAIEIYKVPYGVVNSLNLSYNKYKDLNREEEIITHNLDKITHPGFLPSGYNLRILSE